MGQAVSNSNEYTDAQLKKFLAPTDPRRVLALIKLGYNANYNDRHEDAILYLKTALTEKGKCPQPAVCEFLSCSKLGQIYADRYDFDQAEPYMKTALRLLQHLPTQEMSDELAMFYGAYGTMQVDKGNIAEGKIYLEKGLALDKDCDRCKEVLGEIANSDQSPDYFDVQTQIIRWRDEKHIIYVYLLTGEAIPGWNPGHNELVRKALLKWQVATNERFKFEFVEDPAKSDIRIGWRPDPLVLNGEIIGGRAYTFNNEKYFFIRDMVLSVFDENKKPCPSSSIYTSALHEMGHLLGIHEHSTCSTDLMASDPVTQEISQRDLATLNKIYQAPNPITDPPHMSMREYRLKYYPDTNSPIKLP